MDLKTWPIPSILGVLLLIGLAPAPTKAGAGPDAWGGREMIVYVPAQLPPPGQRALVVVLHGGLGNAAHIEGGTAEKGLKLDAVAEHDGFVVAYLNGTPVTRRLGPNFLGWNAGGGCCGVPAENKVDDVAYIKGAVDFLASKYGIDRGRVFAMGHSNGGAMTQRLICETDVFAAGVPISGPLNFESAPCPGARGKRILAIHGADDANVPVAGGHGTKGVSGIAWQSEAHSQALMTAAGASYTLDLVAGADHGLDHIDAAVQKAEGVSIAQKAARFFGLDR